VRPLLCPVSRFGHAVSRVLCLGGHYWDDVMLYLYTSLAP
jgi:hypothetical protein